MLRDSQGQVDAQCTYYKPPRVPTIVHRSAPPERRVGACLRRVGACLRSRSLLNSTIPVVWSIIPHQSLIGSWRLAFTYWAPTGLQTLADSLLLGTLAEGRTPGPKFLTQLGATEKRAWDWVQPGRRPDRSQALARR